MLECAHSPFLPNNNNNNNNIPFKKISGFGYSSHLGELIVFILSDKPTWDFSCVTLSLCGTSPIGQQILLPLKLVQVLPRALGSAPRLMFIPFKIPLHRQVGSSCPWSSLSKRKVQLFYLAHVPWDRQSCIFYLFEGYLLPDWSDLPWLHPKQGNVESSNHHLAKKGFCLKLQYEGTHRAASAWAYLEQSQRIIKPGCKSNVHFSLCPPTFWGST